VQSKHSMSALCFQIRKEVLAAYKQLRLICDRLQHGKDDSIISDVESMPCEDISPIMLKVCEQ
jgi:hypothetical protein